MKKFTTLVLTIFILLMSVNYASAGKLRYSMLSKTWSSDAKSGSGHDFDMSILGFGPIELGFSLNQSNYGVNRSVVESVSDVLINAVDKGHLEKALKKSDANKPAMYGAYLLKATYGFSGGRGFEIFGGVGRGMYATIKHRNTKNEAADINTAMAYEAGLGYDFRILGPLGVEPYAKVFGLVNDDMLSAAGVNVVFAW